MTNILVLPATAFQVPERPGAWPLGAWERSLAVATWQPRVPCESDERWLQLIPYVLLLDHRGFPWCYRRTGGDPRLRARRSCGLGGHVEQPDARPQPFATLLAGAERELREELVTAAPVRDLRPQAWLHEGESPIGRVHLGVIFTARWMAETPPEAAAGEALQGLDFLAPAEILADEHFELWSRLAATWLIESQS